MRLDPLVLCFPSDARQSADSPLNLPKNRLLLWSGGFPLNALVAPYRAILRWYRCSTPYRAILSQPSQQSPNRVRYPRLAPSFTQTYQCDTPFCNISRDTCAIPQENKREKALRCYRSEGREWGVGSVVVDFRVFGVPRFSGQRSQTTCFKGFCVGF